MAAKRETARRFLLFLKSIPISYYYRILFRRGPAGSCLIGSQNAPFPAIYRPLPNGGSRGGDFNRTANYVWAVRAKSHYQAAVPWFGTEFFYLNLKLT